MTPKEQAIKKAYGEHYDTFKHIISPDGWVSWDRGAPCPNMEETDTHESGLYWRPLSLRGIEDNNGWISVEERLPDDGGECLVWVDDVGAFTAIYDGYAKSFREYNGDDIESNYVKVTHWQPVVKPEAPLY